MPHQQPRSEPKLSPADINGALDAIAPVVSLGGITGSNIEFDGEVGFLVDDDGAIEDVVGALEAAGFKTRLVGERDGLHLDYVDDTNGGLAAAIRRGRAHHQRGVIRDIAVGLHPHGFQLDGTDLVRDQDGNPVDGQDMLLPVQIFFIEPLQFDGNGDPV